MVYWGEVSLNPQLVVCAIGRFPNVLLRNGSFLPDVMECWEGVKIYSHGVLAPNNYTGLVLNIIKASGMG